MSDLLDAICNVNNEDLATLDGQLANLIDELTRELAVATAVRSSLAVAQKCCDIHDGTCIPENRKKPGRKPHDTPAIKATAKTIEVARAILKHGAMTKEELAKRLGWTLSQVAITVGRCKQHFIRREDGKLLVAPDLAMQLEAE